MRQRWYRRCTQRAISTLIEEMKTIEQVDQQRLSTAIQQMDRSAVDKQQQEEGLVQIAPNEQVRCLPDARSTPRSYSEASEHD